MTGSPPNSAGPVHDPRGPLRGQSAGAGSAKAPLKHGKLETVRVGGLVGEMAIIAAHMPRSATVIAGTYCELLEIDVPKFLSLVANTPAFSIAVLRVPSRRLRLMNRRYRVSTTPSL